LKGGLSQSCPEGNWLDDEESYRLNMLVKDEFVGACPHANGRIPEPTHAG